MYKYITGKKNEEFYTNNSYLITDSAHHIHFEVMNMKYFIARYSATPVNDGKCVSVITLKTATNMQKSKKDTKVYA